MPVVTVDPSKYERYELKSAPADPNDANDVNGFVMLRPLPYGLKLTRRDKATKMQMRAKSDGRGRATNQEQIIELDTLNEWATAFDFSYCIGDHNLKDSNGQLLNFADPKTVAMTLKSLNPKVGSEIEKYIGDLNEDEDEQAQEDFTTLAQDSSQAPSDTATDSAGSTTATEPNALHQVT
jgi:hypothetical protein